MGLKYDQRTLNRVFTHLKKYRSNLEKTKSGFKLESKRYLSENDKQNFARTARLVECVSFTMDELDSLFVDLNQIFEGKTNKKKKRIKPI
jgi:hypothetical protein